MNEMNDINEDLWHVEVTSGEVIVVTLEQLDDAFNDGLVNGDTRVWQAGMAAAMPLRELLGLDSDDGAGAAPAEPAVVVPQDRPAHQSPMYPQAPAAAAVAVPRAVPVVSASWPPAVASPPRGSAPPPSSTPPSWQPPIPSVVPTAYDLSDDDVPFAQPKRRGAVAVAVVGVLVAAAGVAAFLTSGGEPTATAATAVARPLPEAPKSHAYDPGGEPAHVDRAPAPVAAKTEASGPSSAAPGKADLAEALREAALKTANAKGSKAHARGKAAPARKSRQSGKSASAGFKGTRGGSKYDPLNGAL